MSKMALLEARTMKIIAWVMILHLAILAFSSMAGALTKEVINVAGQKYPDIAIWNDAHTTKILQLKLFSNTDKCNGNECEAVIKLDNYVAWSLPSAFDNNFNFAFRDVKRAYQSRFIDFHVFTSASNITRQETISYNCTTINTNGTAWQQCNIPNNRTISVPNYNPINLGANVPVGVIYIKLKGTIEAGDTIDWIPNFRGFALNEWANWSSTSIGYNLTAYWSFNNTNGSADNAYGTPDIHSYHYNMTLQKNITGTLGKKGGFYNCSAQPRAYTDLNFSLGSNQVSWSAWISVGSLSGAQSPVTWGLGGVDYQARCDITNASGGIVCYFAQASAVVLTTNGTIATGGWHHLAVSSKSGEHDVYLDNVMIGRGTGAQQANAGTLMRFAVCGLPTASGQAFTGSVDEVAFWRTALNRSDITELWNAGAGFFYGDGETPSTPPLNEQITLKYINPKNNTYTNITSVTFNVTATPSNKNVTNNTFFIASGIAGGVFSQLGFNTSSPAQNTSINFSLTSVLAEGTYHWASRVCSTNNTGGNITCDFGGTTGLNYDNYSLIVDTTPPVVHLIAPTGEQGLLYEGLKTLTAVYSVNDTNLNYSILVYGAVNRYVNTQINSYTFNATKTKSVSILAWDNASNMYANSTSFTYAIEYDNATFKNITTEFGIENFILNATINSSKYAVTSYLNFSGTLYSVTTTSSGNSYSFARSLTMPSVNADTNTTINWYIGLTNSSGTTFYSTPLLNVTIANVSIDDCSINSIIILNYTTWDEDVRTRMVAPTQNNTYELDLYLGNYDLSSYIQYSGNKSEVDEFLICVNKSLNTSLRLDATMKYNSNDYVTEYHNFQNYTISNNSYVTNISLYLLDTLSSDEFLITYKDENYIPVSDVVVEIQRRYLPTGNFINVESPKTDTEGRTIGHFVLNDEIYNIYVKRDGHILSVYNNIRLYCIAGSSCSLNLNAISGTGAFTNGAIQEGVFYWQNYNQATYTYTLEFLSEDGSTKSVNLTLFDFTNYMNDSICNQQISGISGTLQCIVPSKYYNRTIMARGYVGNIQIFTDIFKVARIETANLLNVKYLLGASMVLVLAGMALVSGSAILVIVMAIIGVASASMLYLIDGSIIGASSAILFLIGAGAIIIWKMNKEGSKGT